MAELQRRGLRTIAPDLPTDRHDAGLDAYAEAVVRSCAAATGPLVLVGHSLAGLVISVVALRRPVALLVFLCAALPEPGLSLTEQRAITDRDMLTAAWRTEYLPRQVVLPNGRTTWPAEVDREALFHDCPPAAAGAAVAALRTQNPHPLCEASPLTIWPEVDCAVVLCTEDRVISPDWSRRAARRLARPGTARRAQPVPRPSPRPRRRARRDPRPAPPGAPRPARAWGAAP